MEGASQPDLRREDRLILPLLRRGYGRIFRFQWTSGLGYCCSGVPIRAGQSCWDCGVVVRGKLETWCLAHFESLGQAYRWHLPPSKVGPDLLARSEEIEPHEPTQPVREVPKLDLDFESALALVAHVGDLVANAGAGHEPEAGLDKHRTSRPKEAES